MEEITSPTPQNNNDPNNILITNPRNSTPQQQRARPQKDQVINCPRCNATNTKFCYYNNYSLTQPRYFCKNCRRYWTRGGSLRSVPVGGGSRKNKRSSSSSSGLLPSSTLSSTTIPPPMHNKLIIPDLNPPTSFSNLLNSSQNPNLKFLQAHDLNLAFPIQGLFHHPLPKIDGNNNNHENNHEENININSNNNNYNSSTITANTTSTTPISALELLRSGITSRGDINHPFVPISMSDPSTMYQSGYPNLQDFKPNMNIFSSLTPSIEHNTNNVVLRPDNNNNNNNNINVDSIGGGARLLFPFADMNKLATNIHQQQHQDGQVNDQTKGNGNGNDNVNNNHRSGYWNSMLSGGTWSDQSYH